MVGPKKELEDRSRAGCVNYGRVNDIEKERENGTLWCSQRMEGCNLETHTES